VRACARVYALRIVSIDKILLFTNTATTTTTTTTTITKSTATEITVAVAPTAAQ